jgi:hypothetical protein
VPAAEATKYSEETYHNIRIATKIEPTSIRPLQDPWEHNVSGRQCSWLQKFSAIALPSRGIKLLRNETSGPQGCKRTNVVQNIGFKFPSKFQAFKSRTYFAVTIVRIQVYVADRCRLVSGRHSVRISVGLPATLIVFSSHSAACPWKYGNRTPVRNHLCTSFNAIWNSTAQDYILKGFITCTLIWWSNQRRWDGKDK